VSRHPRRRQTNPLTRGLIFGLLAFFLALFVSFPSREAAERLNISGASLILLFIVALGVLFDMIGVAAASAREEPFNAMAARRVRGARHALDLVHNADTVAAVCADMVGDIAGTVSGAAAAAVVFRAIAVAPQLTPLRTVADAAVVALAAGLTVGGKAACKVYALRSWTQILLAVGKLMWWLERYLHIRFFAATRTRRERRR